MDWIGPGPWPCARAGSHHREGPPALGQGRGPGQGQIQSIYYLYIIGIGIGIGILLALVLVLVYHSYWAMDTAHVGIGTDSAMLAGLSPAVGFCEKHIMGCYVCFKCVLYYDHASRHL